MERRKLESFLGWIEVEILPRSQEVRDSQPIRTGGGGGVGGAKQPGCKNGPDIGFSWPTGGVKSSPGHVIQDETQLRKY